MKRIRILIDIVMAALLLLIFITPRINSFLHIVLGVVLAAVIIIHLLLNRKWLLKSIKNLGKGKLKQPKARYMLKLVIGLIFALLICTATGVAIYDPDYYSLAQMVKDSTEPSVQVLYILHKISAAAFLVLIILHAKVHMR